MMGTGTYGHASTIMLKGQEKAAATRAKKKRERKYEAVTAKDLADRSLVYAGFRVCPCCLRTRRGQTCDHRHPEDNEIFEIPTLEVEFLLVAPDTSVRDTNKE